MSLPSIDIVVCTYAADRRPLLERCVSACRAQLGPADRLVVVVDGGDDRLAETLAGRLGARTQIVVHHGRAGLSGARDRGIAATDGDAVAFVDDDAIPRPGWLDAFREALTDPAVAMVGGPVIAAWSGGEPPAWFPSEYGWVVGCDYPGMPASGPIRNPIGASMAVRRSVLVAVGGFDGRVGRRGGDFAGGEETELALRVRAERPDVLIVRVPGAVVDHLVPRDRQQLGYLVRRCYAEGHSKGYLARRFAGAALESEARHALRTLPREWARVLRRPNGSRNSAAARVAVSAFGLSVTTLGFVVGLTTARGVERYRPSAEAPR